MRLLFSAVRMGLLGLTALALAACAPSGPPVEVTRVVEVTALPRIIRVAYSSEPDFGDLPSLLALALLAEQGYAVLPTHFAQPETAVEAVARGDAEILSGAMNRVWAAVLQGARLVTIMDQVANPWLIYAAPDIQECADLAGKRYALSGEASMTARMTAVYVAETCPGTEYQTIIIQGSGNRAAALLTGEIDATPVELADAIEIDQDAPGRFHALTNFGRDMPGLKVAGFHVQREFAAQNPELVADYLAAVLAVHRQIAQDHSLLSAEATRRLGVDPELAPAITEAYLAINAFDVNGGLDPESVQYTLDFFITSGILEPGLTADDVAELSYLDAALARIGRQ